MRGADAYTESLFTIRKLDDFVPSQHPLRPIRQMVNEALKEIEPLLSAPGNRPHEAEDIWLYLHVLFEIIWKFRFFYRDINDLLTRNRLVETHFQRILTLKEASAVSICEGLAASGELTAPPAEIRALATNMCVVATFWLSFEHARRPRGEPDIGRGVYQVISLAAPYLQGNSRELLEKLSQEYVTNRQ